MGSADVPVTAGVRVLRAKNIPFVPHLYAFEEHGGTRHSAEALGVDEHAVVKTIVFQTEAKQPLIALMHGDREISAKELARIIGVRKIEPCDERSALKFTGYQFGGTSPFGTRTPIPVYAEKSIFALPKIYINGGKRGFLVEIDPREMRKAFPVTEVEVGITAS
ncbi:MAG TPA: aminoacyl-tRNA deacylase [Bacteroidota bacterium]|nr:aminoacyl-tRNA deacylase [Bacteroidota bacterium]